MEKAYVLAKQIGEMIKDSDIFAAYTAAKIAKEADTELEAKIGEFNLVRLSLMNEAEQSNRDEAKLEQMNNQLRSLYDEIMGNRNMVVFTSIQQQISEIIGKVTNIITCTIDGVDPDSQGHSCNGSCSSCGGCH